MITTDFKLSPVSTSVKLKSPTFKVSGVSSRVVSEVALAVGASFTAVT